MKILFASASPYLPQVYGGVNTNTHDLISELTKQGHQASVLARLSYGNSFGVSSALGMALTGQPLREDDRLGYPVFRTRRPWTVAERIPSHDVIVLQDGRVPEMAAAFKRLGFPTIAYFHGLEFEDWGTGSPIDGTRISYMANSGFTAARLRSRLGTDPTVIIPVFPPERYRSAWQPFHVTFINPVQEKGVELALSLAEECSEIPFQFVKGWPLGVREGRRLARRIKALGNVTLVDRTADMRPIYERCKVLLVPSVWPRETWGRVVSEAQISGIPVLGSDVGGLPEAIGPGGVVLSPDQPTQEWASELRRLWHDQTWFETKSRMALDHSKRPAMDVKQLTQVFVSALQQAIDSQSAAS